LISLFFESFKMPKCNYPGCESENLNYYEQFNPAVKEKWKESYEKLPSIWQFLKWWLMEFNFGGHTYKYQLIKIKDLQPDSKLLDFLSQNWFDVNKIYKVSQLTFYNKRLYQWKYLFLIYKIQNWKLKIYGAIDSNENIEKFTRPLEYSLDIKYSLWEKIAKLLWCNNCKVKIDWNQILIYKKEIKEHHRTYKKWFIQLDLEWWKKVKYKPVWQILLWPYGGLIKNTKWQVIWRLENYGNEWVVVNTNWKIVANFKNETIVNLNLPELQMDVKLKLKDF